MPAKRFYHEASQIIIHTDGMVCSSARDLVQSEVFDRVVSLYIDHLRGEDSQMLDAFPTKSDHEDTKLLLSGLLRALAEYPLAEVAKIYPYARQFLETERNEQLSILAEKLYDFWRNFDRFMVLHSEPGPGGLDQRPYRAFNSTIESLTHLVRGVYRDVLENITGDHPRVYRQVTAGCDVGIIAVPKPFGLPERYKTTVANVPFIRQAWIAPPLIIDPPMNKRTGRFQKVEENPLEGLEFGSDEWLCYPAQVGPVTIFVYFHQRFISLGISLANLFELATDDQIAAGPQAIYAYGAPPESLARFGDLPTVFFDDEEHGLLVAAVPGEDRFGYFGYIKKMVLTLHNIVMMKRGRMPFHGAMTRIVLKGGASANVLMIGDTATGKSESLEAFRLMGKEHIRDLRVVADDMGSLEVAQDGTVRGYGTEIGAFVRLDDLQQGYAFGQIDRSIFMSPQKINARVVLPVTSLPEVLRGYPIDFLIYANNYEEVDDEHPIIERLESAEKALEVFGEGRAMTKGTTTSSGIVTNYFANIFGPPQYQEIHDRLARETFQALFDAGVYTAEMRTRLGLDGWEAKGPEEAAKALLKLIAEQCEPKG